MKNTVLVFLLLFFCINNSTAQKAYGFLEIDKSTTLDLLAIRSKSDTLSMLVVSDAAQSKDVKITPWIVRIHNNILIEKKEIKLSKVCKKDEEKLRSLIRLKNGNILMLSNSDKKEYELAARLLSPEGNVLKEQKIADDVRTKSFRIQQYNDNSEIRITYYNSELNAQCFLFYNDELELISQKQIAVDLKTEKDYLFENVLYDGDHAYCIDYNFLDKDSELGVKQQFLICKINIAEGKLEKKTQITEKKHITYPRYFIRKGLLEVFMLSSSTYDKVDDAIVQIISIRLSDLTILKKKELRQFNGVTSIDGLSSFQMELLAAAKDSAQRANLLAAFKSMKSKPDPKAKKNRMSSSANFKVSYNALTGQYALFCRLATEESYNTSEFNSSTGSSETVTYYSTSFGNTDFSMYNPSNDSFTRIGEFENAFGMGGNKFSKLYLNNQSGGDYAYKSTSEPNVFLFAYITGVESIDHTVHFRIMENKQILSKTYKVSPGTSGNTFFYLQTIQEVAPNIFICDVYTRGKGSRIMVFNLNTL